MTTAPSCVSISPVTPKTAPVTRLIRIKAITAAKAPPARSFAQEPPIAAAKRICRFVIMAQPIFSMTEPISNRNEKSVICSNLPILSMIPAAGMTAITVIKTFPSFCRKSKLIPFFSFGRSVTAVSAAISDVAGISFSFRTINVSCPAVTSPSAVCKSRSSAPLQITTGVMAEISLLFRKSRSISAIRSPFTTESPTFTWLINPSPFRCTVSSPTWIRISIPSFDRKP